jgi:putative endonuclease
MWYVYILLCNDGSYYTGITNNLEKRINTHNLKKGAKYTRGRTPVVLLASWEYQTKSEVLKREIEIKKMSKKEKEELIKTASTPELLCEIYKKKNGTK